MTGGRSLVALSVAVLTIGVAAPAGAQTAPLPRRSQQPAAAAKAPAPAATKGRAPAAAPAKGKAPAATPAEARKPAGRKVVRLEEMRVEGRIQKPQALMLMPRASVASGDVERNESFLPQVKDATQKDPF